MLHPTSGCADARSAACPCARCDVLLGLDGVHVEHVDRSDGALVVTVSSPVARRPGAQGAGSSPSVVGVAGGCCMTCPA